MHAKQILWSASFVVVIGGTARAQPAATAPSDPPPPTEAPKQPTGTFSVGAGYNTDDGLSFGAGIEQSSLFGTGRLLALDASLSARHERFEMRYSDPRSLGDGFVLDASIYSDHRLLPGFTREAVGTALTISHALGPHARGYLTYRVEHVDADSGDVLLARGRPVGPTLDHGVIASLRAGMEYSTLDAKLAPLHGTNIGTYLEVADPRLGSDYSIATIRSWANTHQSFGPLTMHVGGSLTTVTSPSTVPLSERLYLDGSSEIRGYAPGALNPIDPATGLPFGGNMEMLGRAELEAPLIRRVGISMHAFYDVGGIFDIHGIGHAGSSVGFGLLWRSPIGPLSFDWAYPLDGSPPRFLVNVGGVF